MQPQSWDQNRSSIPVVARVVDVLQVEGGKDASPDVRRVVVLEDRFASIVEVAVTQQKAQPAEPQILPGDLSRCRC